MLLSNKIMAKHTRKEECPFPALDPGGRLEVIPTQSGLAMHLCCQTNVLSCNSAPPQPE